MVAGAVGFDDDGVGCTLQEEFVGLVGLEAGQFSCVSGRCGDGDAMVLLLPGDMDHFEEGGGFVGDDEGVCFAGLGWEDVGGGGGDDAFAALGEFAGKGVHGGCFATCSDDGDEGVGREVEEGGELWHWDFLWRFVA